MLLMLSHSRSRTLSSMYKEINIAYCVRVSIGAQVSGGLPQASIRFASSVCIHIVYASARSLTRGLTCSAAARLI